MSCSAYLPNGEGVFRCRFYDESNVHKCPRCGYCNAFRPLTDDDAELESKVTELMKTHPDFPLENTTFNRWRWKPIS